MKKKTRFRCLSFWADVFTPKNPKNVGILWVWDTIDDHASRSLRIGRKEEQEEKKKILVSE
jgi:hypothetical protein